jgi:hypothetical protein
VTISRFRFSLALLVVGAVSLTAVGVASAGGSKAEAGAHASVEAASKCSQLNIQVRPVKVIRVSASTGYNYRVEGVVYVPHNGQLSGCGLKVCEAEELGAGNWKPSWCNDVVISASQHYYISQAPYVACKSYGGTGYFRSYARFSGASGGALGVETRLCKNHKPVY